MAVSQISFQGVYKSNESFSEVQDKISQRITETLTSSFFADKKGKTPDDKLKDKGYDTLLSPAGKDTVDVFIVTDFKKSTENQPPTYKDCTYVGTYNNRDFFSYNHVKDAMNSKKNHSFAWKPIILLPIFAVIGFLMKYCSKPKETLPTTENIFPITQQNTIKILSLDTLKLAKKMK